MSFIPVLQYITGIGVLGFVYWLLDGIKGYFVVVDVHVGGDIWNLLNYIWVAVILIYLIFGGIWLIRKYAEREYQDGGVL